jgi:cyclopropane fatty-acyl-phospholipid synthase-like methyltransferase
MTEKQLDFIISFHTKLYRQGPGSDGETLQAIKLTGLSESNELNVLDLGCGTGAQTNVLANHLNGTITALDLFQPFLDELEDRIKHPNVQTFQGSMDDLPFEKESFDLIWSEGAVYNMGFENGLKYLHPFLKKNGVIALSEITWLTNERPAEIEAYWNNEYAEIDTAQGKIKTLDESGYELIDHFILSEESWLSNYYCPLEKQLAAFKEALSIAEEIREVIQSYQNEIGLYKMFKEYFGYGFYIARKVN